MNRLELEETIQGHFDQIMSINQTKGHDYAGDEDALSNIKEAANSLDLEPAQVWAVYANKHWTSVLTFCKEGDVKSEPIEGRLHDMILYCFLLLCLLKEGTAFNQTEEPEVAPTGQFG